MLLYTNEIKDIRQSAGLLPINSFWISGTGAMNGALAAVEPCTTPVIEVLRAPALSDDWPAWTAAWRNLDATFIAQLHTALDKGEAISLTLCGERNSQTWTSSTRRGPLQSIGSHLAGMFAGMFAGKRVPALLQAL